MLDRVGHSLLLFQNEVLFFFLFFFLVVYLGVWSNVQEGGKTVMYNLYRSESAQAQ